MPSFHEGILMLSDLGVFLLIDCCLVKTLCYSCLNQYGPPPVTNTIYLSYKSFRSCVPTLYWGQWERAPENPASKILYSKRP